AIAFCGTLLAMEQGLHGFGAWTRFSTRSSSWGFFCTGFAAEEASWVRLLDESDIVNPGARLMNRSERDTPDLWDSLLDLPHGHLSTWKQGVKAGNLAGKRASLSLRFGVRHLLGAI